MNRNKFYKLFPVILFLFVITWIKAPAQSDGNFKDIFLEAETYFLFEEYADALPLYQKLLGMDPENYNINYKVGICYLNDRYRVSRSITYLETATKGTSAAYRINNFRERMAPTEAYYYLGNAYRVNNRLDDAIKTYQHFLTVLDPLVYDTDLVEAQIEACKVAASLKSRPVYYRSSNIGTIINNEFDEINPVISGDESVMAFTRRLQFYDAVFITEKVNGRWTEPVNLTPYFAVDGNTYVTGISYSGDELYVYRSDDYDGNIYVSRKANGQWSKLQKLNDNINTKYWESHASVSEDGRILYFTSNRKGGYGGLDIYKSVRTEKGDWGPAENLGPVINTKYNEETPFITDDGTTLFFSSMGHYTMGGYDIFYSNFSGNRWSVPVNLGYPINTTNDDVFFVPASNGINAYYSYYDPDKSQGLGDIYKMDIYTSIHPRKFTISGNAIVDGLRSRDYTGIKVTLNDLQTKEAAGTTTLNRDGTFTLEALAGEYEMVISGEDLNSAVERISIPANNPSEVISLGTRNLSMSSTGQIQETSEVIASAYDEEGPFMRARVQSLNVTSDKSIPIQLELETGTTLQVETRVNGEYLKTEEFDINRRNFQYLHKPFQGENILEFTLTDPQGRSSSLEVMVTYTPEISGTEEIAEEKPTVTGIKDKYQGIASLADGNLRKFLEDILSGGESFRSTGELYDYLISNAPEYGVTSRQVDSIMSLYLSQKELNHFTDELRLFGDDAVLQNLDLLLSQDTMVYTSGSIVEELFRISADDDLDGQLRESLYRIASNEKDPAVLVDLLQSFSSDEVDSLLEEIRYNPQSIAEVLLNVDTSVDAWKYSDLESSLKKAAYILDADFLYLSLLDISTDSLRAAISEINLADQKIENSGTLVSYLLDISDIKGYEKGQLIDNIEVIRSDPYYFVEVLRRAMTEKATGSLKSFLQELNLRSLRLDTYEKLINYLFRQSDQQDFNREMIYQLLIDIIYVESMEEFLDLLNRFADSRIRKSLDATETGQFSKPIELVQFMISNSDDFGYSEKDILNLLLKIFFERKPATDIPAGDSGGWFKGIDRNAMIKALIVVNTAIIILIIFLIFRRKQKKEMR